MSRRRKRLTSLAKTGFEESAYLNDKTYIDIYNRMKELALNRFVYEGMPDSVSQRYLEMMLYEQGFCFFFREDVLNEYYALGGTMRRGFDVYGNWLYYTAISATGKYRKNIDWRNSVIWYNNYTRVPTKSQVQLFAYRAYNIIRTMDTNVSQQKTLKMFKVPEQRRLTMENLVMKVIGNEIYAFVSDDLIAEELVLDFTVPYVADKLWQNYQQVWNDYYNFLGIINHASDKREREVSIEVMGRMGSTEAMRNTALRSRQEAVKATNDMFGLDISVKFNSEISTFFDDNLVDLWGDDSGNLHDDNEGNSGEPGTDGDDDLQQDRRRASTDI